MLPSGLAPGLTTVANAHVPPFARWPYQPFSREAAIQIAYREWRVFGQPVVFPHTELPFDNERAEGLWQRVGDISIRLGQYDKAAEAYANAAQVPTLDPGAVVSRRVFANLRLGRPAERKIS